MTVKGFLVPTLFVMALSLLLCGCEKAMQNMYDQPRYKAFAASTLFADGASARTPPEGTLPYAPETGPSPAEKALDAQTQPYPLTQELLQRGQERFTIYCEPCHSPLGDGDGLVARRGFPHPPSYHDERLRQASDRHFFDVITQGYGIMYSYADRVAPADRWAIVAYIRALQLSQRAKAADLPAEARRQLAAGEEGR